MSDEPPRADLLAPRRGHGFVLLKPDSPGLDRIEGRESLTVPTKVRLESHYLRHMSVPYDLRIIVGTLRAVLSKKGAL